MQPHIRPPSQALIATAERLLSEALGGCIRLGAGALLQDGIRSLVYRFPILDGLPQAPTSVIVKQVKSTERAPHEPQRATMPAWAFFNEWASLQFLRIIAEGAFGPRFYSGDAARSVLVMEDLGQGTSLEQFLMGNDPAAAASALIEFAEVHSRLHAAAIGKHDEFIHLRESLGPHMLEDGYQTYEWFAPTLYQAAEVLGVTPAHGVEQEVAALKASLLHPGPFLSLIQGTRVQIIVSFLALLHDWWISKAACLIMHSRKGSMAGCTFRHAAMSTTCLNLFHTGWRPRIVLS